MARFACVLMLLAVSAASDLPQVSAQGTMGVQPMTEAMPADRFWELIDKTTRYEADQDAQMEALRAELRKLSAEEIEAFERAFHDQQRRAYSWDLWGAAYVIIGFSSDDVFEYFQRWLIAKGRKTFEAAITDPDSLATTISNDLRYEYDFEGYAYVAGSVWHEKTGIDPLNDPDARFPYTGMPPAPQPSGKPYENNAAYLSKHYPKLWARFRSP